MVIPVSVSLSVDVDIVYCFGSCVDEYIWHSRRNAEKLQIACNQLVAMKDDLKTKVENEERKGQRMRSKIVEVFIEQVESLEQKVAAFFNEWRYKLKFFIYPHIASKYLDEVSILRNQYDDLDNNWYQDVEQVECRTTHVKGIYWNAMGNMSANDIDTNLFTHVFYYCTENIDKNSGNVTVPRKRHARKFTSTLYKKNHSVKVILTMENIDATVISLMVENASFRKSFIESSIQIARSCNFSGFNLSCRAKIEKETYFNFSILLEEWHSAALAEAMKTKRTRLLLTTSVLGLSGSLNSPISSLKKYIDWINVPAWCYYSPMSHPSSTHSPSPLPNIKSTIDSWIQAGLPRDKIVLGITFFGFAWKLLYPTQDFGIGAKAKGYNACIPYKEITTFIKDKNIKNVYDEPTASNYFNHGKTWIGYNDVQAIGGKISYARQSRLLGYVAWDNTMDDDYILSKTASETWDSTALLI